MLRILYICDWIVKNNQFIWNRRTGWAFFIPPPLDCCQRVPLFFDILPFLLRCGECASLILFKNRGIFANKIIMKVVLVKGGSLIDSSISIINPLIFWRETSTIDSLSIENFCLEDFQINSIFNFPGLSLISLNNIHLENTSNFSNGLLLFYFFGIQNCEIKNIFLKIVFLFKILYIYLQD